MKNSIVTKELFYKKICCLENQVNDIPVLPTASVNDTLRYNGASWVASSFLTNDGSGVNIGSGIASYSLDSVGASDAWRLPNGPTGDRPFPASGIIRWNTDLQNFEFSDGAVWEELYRGLQYWVEGTDSAVAEIKYFQVNSPSSNVSAGLLTKGTGGIYIGNVLPTTMPTDAVVIGNGSYAKNPQNVAIGYNAFANSGVNGAIGAVVIGSNVEAVRGGVTIGYNSINNGDGNQGGVAIGTNVSAGLSSVSLGYLSTTGHKSVSIGPNNTTATFGVSIGGNNNSSIRQYSILIGHNNSVAERTTNAIGNNNSPGNESFALGNYNRPDGHTLSYSAVQPPSVTTLQAGVATILSREITGTAAAVLGKGELTTGINPYSFIACPPGTSMAGRVDILVRVITPGSGGLVDTDIYSYHYTFNANGSGGPVVITSQLLSEHGATSLSTGSVSFYTTGPSDDYFSFEYTPPATADATTVLYVAAMVQKIEIIE